MERDADPHAEILAACQGKAGRMVLGMREAWERHAAACSSPPKAILLHPANFELIGWEEALGLPVLAEPRVEPDGFWIHCGLCGGQLNGATLYWDEAGRPYASANDEALATALGESDEHDDGVAAHAECLTAPARA